jgi:hypothetical protein
VIVIRCDVASTTVILAKTAVPPKMQRLEAELGDSLFLTHSSRASLGTTGCAGFAMKLAPH